MSDYHLVYPSVDKSEERFLDDLQGILDGHDVGSETANRVALALSEAVNNALVHGNAGDPGKQVTVDIDINADRLRADIADEGQDGLGSIRRRRKPAKLSESGRGVDLMAYYADDLLFATTVTGGLRVTLQFELKKARPKILRS